MAFSSIQLGLRAGPGQPDPAPAELMQALRSVEVTQHDSAPRTFQLTFQADDLAPGGADALQPFSRVLVRVAVDGEATTLIDGYVTSQQVVPSNAGDSTFVVGGEDVSVLMNLISYSREFPAMGDPIIAAAVLAPWELDDIDADVSTDLATLVPYENVPQQAGTDRCYLQELAAANGFVFYVRPDDELFHNTAYWGPPDRDAPVAAVLDAVTGASSNVESMRFTYDALAPVAYAGYVMQAFLPPYFPVPVITTSGDREPAFASSPALSAVAVLTGKARGELWRQQQLDPVRANHVAQALTNTSTDAVVVGTCEVDVARLGTVVTAPGVVGVRGAGTDYDGLYYLKQATHSITAGLGGQWDYRQSLTLTREGMGTTRTRLEPA